jgi:hypothetical protein
MEGQDKIGKRVMGRNGLEVSILMGLGGFYMLEISAAETLPQKYFIDSGGVYERKK